MTIIPLSTHRVRNIMSCRLIVFNDLSSLMYHRSSVICHLSSITGKTTWARHAFSRIDSLPDGEYKEALMASEALRFRIAFDEVVAGSLQPQADYRPILGKKYRRQLPPQQLSYFDDVI